MRVALYAQAALLVAMVPVVLIVPEIPLGRVVAADLRWIVAGCAGSLGVLSAAMGREPALRRAGAAAIAVGACIALVGVLIEGRSWVLAPLLLASLGVSAGAWRSAA